MKLFLNSAHVENVDDDATSATMTMLHAQQQQR